MPNYCENVLTVEGSEAEVKRFIAENSDPLAIEESPRIISFEMASPTPPEMLGDGGDWYHWRLFNWGVKWDASDAYPWEVTYYGEKVSARTEFITPWGEPKGWMETIAPSYPQLMIQLDYVEHGNENCGDIVLSGGEIFFEEKIYDRADYGLEPYEEDEDE